MSARDDELARALHDVGATHAFVVASQHNLALVAALEGLGVHCVSLRSELGAVHMADGYARVTSRLTPVITSTGPAAGHAVGAFANAAKDGAPVIHVCTSNFVGDGRAHGFHAVPEQGAWLSAYGSPVFDLAHAGQMERLTEHLRAARPGPAAVILPAGAGGPAPIVLPRASAPGEARLRPSPSDVRRALDRWISAPRRMLWLGNGARFAPREQLLDLISRSGAAVVTTAQAKDLLALDHSCFAGCSWIEPHLRDVVGSADACLALGSRMGELSTGAWGAPFPESLVQVSLSEEEPLFEGVSSTHLRTDLRDVLTVLEGLDLGASTFGTESAREMRQRRRGRDSSRIEHRMLDALASALDRGDVVVADTTRFSIWSVLGLDLPPGARFLHPGLMSTGFALPAALGASLAAPESHVVVLTGDGSLLSAMSDLDRARDWPGRVTILLFDDDGYGRVKDWLSPDLSARICGFQGPEWGQLAAAFGIEFVDAPHDPAGALREASPGVRLIRIPSTEVGFDWREIWGPLP